MHGYWPMANTPRHARLETRNPHVPTARFSYDLHGYWPMANTPRHARLETRNPHVSTARFSYIDQAQPGQRPFNILRKRRLKLANLTRNRMIESQQTRM